MKNTSNNLREFRYRKLLKQSEVATKIGLSSSDRISQWESGQSVPGIDNLFKLACLFEVNPQDLYPGLWEKSKLDLVDSEIPGEYGS